MNLILKTINRFSANIASIFLSLLAIKNAQEEEERCILLINSSKASPSVSHDAQKKVIQIRKKAFYRNLALLKSLCDWTISSNTTSIRLSERLFGRKLHDGIIGAVGCLSASIVLYNTWPNVQESKEESK